MSNAAGGGTPGQPRGGDRAASPEPLRVRGVLEATLCAENLDAAETFYTEVLGFEVYAKEDGRHLFFRCGSGMFLIFDPDGTAAEVSSVNGADIPPHGTRGAGHVAFRASREEIDRWRARLERHGVAIESAVDWPTGGHSIFFRDPADNLLEFGTPSLWGLEDES